MQYFSSFNWFTQQWEPENSYCSAMPWATGLQFYYVIAGPKIGANISKQNTLNAIVFKLQLIYSTVRTSSSYCSARDWGKGLHFHYVVADPKVGEQHI